jgi:RNA polymerase sigma-70 factor (ECF subfamily)
VSAGDFERTLWDRIARAVRGEPEAQGELFRRYRPPLERFIARQGFDAQAAEELSQEVIRRVLQPEVLAKADRERSMFRTFLLGIATNVVREERRRRRRQGGPLKQLDGPIAGDEERTLLESVPSKEEEESFLEYWKKHVLALALEKLSPEDRDLLTAHYRDGLKQAQIAARKGWPVGTVKTRLGRARERLEELVRELIYEYSSSRHEARTELALLAKMI